MAEAESEKRTLDIQLAGSLFGTYNNRSNVVKDVPPPEEKNSQFSITKLIPLFFFNMVVTEPADSIKRKNEEEELTKEKDNFLKTAIEIDPRVSDHDNTDLFIENYNIMQQKNSTFLKKCAEVNNKLPIIVVLGHGSPDGTLCFNHGKDPQVVEILADIDSWFEARRPEDLPSWFPRVIFSQCYAHLIHDSNHTPGEIRLHGRVEFLYITSPSSPKSIADIDYTQDTSLLKKLVFDTDIDIDIDLTADLTHDFMRTTLEIICPLPDTYKFKDVLTNLKRQLDITIDDTQEVQSVQDLDRAISSFLTGDAKVYMPMVFIRANGGMNSNGQFMLHIDQDTPPLDAQTTLNVHRKENPNLRLIIMFVTGTSYMLVTNSVPGKILDSKMEMLHKFAPVIVADSQHNKTGIQVPAEKSSSTSSLEAASITRPLNFEQEAGNHEESISATLLEVQITDLESSTQNFNCPPPDSLLKPSS